MPSRTGTPTPADLEASFASDEELLRSLTSLAADQLWLEKETLRLFDEQIGPLLLKSQQAANQSSPDETTSEQEGQSEILELMRGE